jgi:hypothetical protein
MKLVPMLQAVLLPSPDQFLPRSARAGSLLPLALT